MSRRLMLVLALVGLLAAVAVPVAIATSHGPETKATVLTATVTGDGETTPVTSDGAGVVTITIDKKKRLLCYDISITGVDPVAIHIHEGAAGVDGGIAVDLTAFGDLADAAAAQAEGCSISKDDVRKPLLKAIKQNPEGYYINVHTAEHPSGELRGQLSR